MTRKGTTDTAGCHEVAQNVIHLGLGKKDGRNPSEAKAHPRHQSRGPEMPRSPRICSRAIGSRGWWRWGRAPSSGRTRS